MHGHELAHFWLGQTPGKACVPHNIHAVSGIAKVGTGKAGSDAGGDDELQMTFAWDNL